MAQKAKKAPKNFGKVTGQQVPVKGNVKKQAPKK